MTPGQSSPVAVVDVDATTPARIRLNGGCRFELRTDLEVPISPGTIGGVYPMVLVTPVGNSGIGGTVAFHKLLPIVLDVVDGGQELDLLTTTGAGLVWVREVS